MRVRLRLGRGRPSWAFNSPAFVPNGSSRTTPSTTVLPRTSLSVATPPQGSVLPSAALAGADPGVSHLHAVLLAEPDGGWSVLDPGSSNGTQLNGREVPTGQRVPLRDGDQIGLGAWTVLTIRAG